MYTYELFGRVACIVLLAVAVLFVVSNTRYWQLCPTDSTLLSCGSTVRMLQPATDTTFLFNLREAHVGLLKRANTNYSFAGICMYTSFD